MEKVTLEMRESYLEKLGKVTLEKWEKLSWKSEKFYPGKSGKGYLGKVGAPSGGVSPDKPGISGAATKRELITSHFWQLGIKICH